MKPLDDPDIRLILGSLAALLAVATIIGQILRVRCRNRPPAGCQSITNLNQRIFAWWVMVAAVFLFFQLGYTATVVFFGLISFFALREFISLITTRTADHRTLFWAFFVITPLQYYFVATQWYGMMSILIPVYGFIFVAIRSVLRGDPTDYLARTAEIQWGLLLCVYSLSHIPALLMLDIPGMAGSPLKLVLFLLIVTQMSDILQYVFGKCLGRRPVAPGISPNKTVEGLVGGGAAACLIGTILHGLTPFNLWQAAGMSALLVLLGFSGGLVMSAIKRDQGVKDFGSSIPGHGGMLDRMDSLCFSAPVYFHLIRYYFSA